MMTRRSDSEWERFGKVDPYYGVITLDKYRRDRLTPEAREEFFRSGEEHIAFVLERVSKALASDFAPARALDFGCGVGRCTMPLASRCTEAVGVDVSSAMLDEARTQCEARGLSNVRFVPSDDTLSQVEGRFDFVHSFITFQHIPPARGLRLFARLADLLNDGGAGVVQFVYDRQVSHAVKVAGWLRRKLPLLHNLLNLAAGKPFAEPLVEKNVYDLNRLFRVLEQAGCGRVHVMFEGEGALRSVVLFFQKTVDRLPYEVYYNANRAEEQPGT